VKVCNRCLIQKPLAEFMRDKRLSTGIGAQCKSCACEKTKLRRLANIDAFRAKDRERNKTLEFKATKKKSVQKNILKVRAYAREYNKEYIKTEKARATKRKWEINVRNISPFYRMKANICSLIRAAFRNNGYGKSTRTLNIIGCTYDELKNYLELKFMPDMTWANMGEWEIDHIIPVSSATSLEDMLRLNHYSNLQPMWGAYNSAKHNRLPVEWAQYITDNNLNLGVRP